MKLFLDLVDFLSSLTFCWPTWTETWQRRLATVLSASLEISAVCGVYVLEIIEAAN